MSNRIPVWTLSDRLRKAREFAGLEQTELAERLGVSISTVSNYERGRGPRFATLRAWAQICGVSFAWIADVADDQDLRARRDSNPQPSDLVRAVLAQAA